MIDASAGRPRQPIAGAALAVAALALAAALLMVFVVWPAQRFVAASGDPYNYAGIARQMLTDGFAAHGLTKREASLYPIAIAGVYRLVGERPLVISLIQCVLFAGTCLLVVDIGRRVFDARTGIVAGVLVAINPVPLRYVADLHMETLLTFVVTLNVWSMVRFHARPTIARGLAVGALAGLAALTKGVAIVAPLAFGIVLVVRGVRMRQAPWAAIAAIAIATVAVIAPWTANNYRVTGGRFVPLAPGLSDAFLRGYVFSRAEFALLRRPPYTDAENECNEWFAEICRRAGTEFGRDEVRDEQILGAVAVRKIVDEPLELVRKTVVGLFTFWYQMTTLVNSLVTGGIAAAAWGLAAAGFRRARHEGRPLWLLLTPILSMNVAIALLCSLGRYSMPILPCLFVLSAFGLVSMWRRERVAVAAR